MPPRLPGNGGACLQHAPPGKDCYDGLCGSLVAPWGAVFVATGGGEAPWGGPTCGGGEVPCVEPPCGGGVPLALFFLFPPRKTFSPNSLSFSLRLPYLDLIPKRSLSASSCPCLREASRSRVACCASARAVDCRTLAARAVVTSASSCWR